MVRIIYAKKAFKGTCGHSINSGRRVIIVQKPQFLCNECGTHHVKEHISTLRKELPWLK